MLNEARQKESVRREGETEREVIGATGGWTVKGGAEHSSTLEGKAISGPQLKTNTCLLTSPLSWLVKSQWNDVCIGTLPLPRSVSPSKLEGPNRERCRQSGELDRGQIGENARVLAASGRKSANRNVGGTFFFLLLLN